MSIPEIHLHELQQKAIRVIGDFNSLVFVVDVENKFSMGILGILMVSYMYFKNKNKSANPWSQYSLYFS